MSVDVHDYHGHAAVSITKPQKRIETIQKLETEYFTPVTAMYYFLKGFSKRFSTSQSGHVIGSLYSDRNSKTNNRKFSRKRKKSKQKKSTFKPTDKIMTSNLAADIIL